MRGTSPTSAARDPTGSAGSTGRVRAAILALLTGAALTLPPSTAGAGTTDTRGSEVGVEEALPAKLQPDGGPAPAGVLRRRRYDLSLLAPVPVGALGGMFLVKADLAREQSAQTGADAAPLSWNRGDLAVAGIGAVYLPHAKEGAPRFFLAAARYGGLGAPEPARAMGEFVVGADLDDDDAPWRLKLHPTDDGQTRVLVRLRRFPGFQRWLLLVGHRIEMASGLGLDLAVPSHALVSWTGADDVWRLYGGVRFEDRSYPLMLDATHPGWMTGYTGTRLVGVRRQLARPAYLALEAGAQQWTGSFLDEHGATHRRERTRWSPWVRVALETWIRTP